MRCMWSYTLLWQSISSDCDKHRVCMLTQNKQIRWITTDPESGEKRGNESEPGINKESPPPFHKDSVDTENLAKENQKRELDRIQNDPEQDLTSQLKTKEFLECCDRVY